MKFTSIASTWVAAVLGASLWPLLPVNAVEIRVGAAAVALQADDSMILSGGIGPRQAKGQEGELRAVAIVITDQNGTKVALVACDVLFTPGDLVDAALREIEQTVGIPAQHVLINATHTHHAPCTVEIHGCLPDERFREILRSGIVEAVRKANASLSADASSFFFHLGEETTVGANSRLLMKDGRIHWIGSRTDAVRPTGPFDPQLPVLAFRDPQGGLQALLYNHSTHTIGTRRGAVRSPSFYGLAAQELEKELGGIVCFLEGASGSTHNITGVATKEAIRRMKQAVTEALQQAQRRPVKRLVSVKRRFSYRVREFDEETEDGKVVTYVRKYAPSIADKTITIFRDMRRQLKPVQGQQRETWIQVVLIGDVAIVGVPAEYFTSLGADIKKRSPFRYTYIAELANDWIGYLPDREGHGLGGYQTWTGLHSYAEVGTGERMADEVIAMLKTLAVEPGGE